MEIDVRDNPGSSRYELVHDGAVVGVADYRERDDVVVLPHTHIEPARRGQGLGEQLVRAALDDLRSKGRRVVPRCWFVAEFIELNPEYGDLVAD